MALPSSGAISLNQIQTEFGGQNPISFSEYYRGGAYVNNSVIGPNITSSGSISLGNFLGAYLDVKGQAEYTAPGTYIWTVPAGVTSVSVVCVGGGAQYSDGGTSSFAGANGTLTAGGGARPSGGAGTALGSALSTGVVGGGNGGAGGTVAGRNKGGGGAGGYSGNGGNGNNTLYGGAGGGGVGIFGGTGAGGGGGYGPDFGPQTRGAGASGGTGGGESVTQGGIYGGGAGTGDGGNSTGAGGGGLRYVTSYAVMPGQTCTVTVGGGGSGNVGGKGAVRIIWGAGRAYPNTNTANQ